jgi:spoIIIJ-associated protein
MSDENDVVPEEDLEQKQAESAEQTASDDDDDDEGDLDDDGNAEADDADTDNETSDDGGDDAPPKRKRRRRKSSGESAPPPDERAQAALDFVSRVVEEMEMDCRVRLRRPKSAEDQDEVNIEIFGKDAGRIIGKKGSVLQALQFLTHRVINRPSLDRRHVLVDAEGYRSRRDDSLATMARRLGKQAVDQGKIITFEPMNPRDRRVVHLALAKFEGVITKSDGEGDDRRVQIIPVRR